MVELVCWEAALVSFDGTPTVAIRKRLTLRRNADFTGKLRVTGLKAATAYAFSIGSRRGAFTTPQPPDAHSTASGCSFVFGSCIGGQGYGRQLTEGFPIFNTMGGLKPDFFHCNGDCIYADNAVEAAPI